MRACRRRASRRSHCRLPVDPSTATPPGASAGRPLASGRILRAAPRALVRDQERRLGPVASRSPRRAAWRRLGGLPATLPALDSLRIESEAGTRPVAVSERSELIGVRVDPLPITPEQLRYAHRV